MFAAASACTPCSRVLRAQIHKCQGMSLDYCVVSLDRVFAPGQAYVALSRARSLDGMQLVGTASAKSLKTDPIVRDFYRAVAAGCVVSRRLQQVQRGC